MGRPAVDTPIRPSYGGAIECSCRVFISSVRNLVQEDITDRVKTGTIDIDWDGDVSIVGRFDIEGRDVVRGYTNFIAPYWTTRWLDKDMNWRSVTEQLGLLIVTPQGRTYNSIDQTTHIEAYSLEWGVGQAFATRGMNFQPGVDYGDIASEIIRHAASDILRRMPDTGVRNTKPFKVKAFDNLLAAASSAYRSAGWHRIYPTHDGRLVSRQVTRLNLDEPDRILSSKLGDVYEEARLTPDMSGFATDVYYQSNDPADGKEAVKGFHISNVDPKDPYSRINLHFPISRAVVSSEGDTDETRRRNAIAMLERAASVTTMLELSVPPDPRILPHGVMQLDIKLDDGIVVAGKANWFAKKHRFDVEAKTQHITLQKIADIRGVT